jgi:hypothetical protein
MKTGACQVACLSISSFFHSNFLRCVLAGPAAVREWANAQARRSLAAAAGQDAASSFAAGYKQACMPSLLFVLTTKGGNINLPTARNSHSL